MCPQKCHSRCRHVDQLRNLVVSSTWISINVGQYTLLSTLVLLTERTDCLPKEWQRKERNALPLPVGAITKGWLQKAGRQAAGTSATIFPIMQRSHLFSCSCHRFIQIPETRQVYTLLWSFSCKNAVKAVHCSTVAWLNLCNGLVPQAVHKAVNDVSTAVNDVVMEAGESKRNGWRTFTTCQWLQKMIHQSQ